MLDSCIRTAWTGLLGSLILLAGCPISVETADTITPDPGSSLSPSSGGQIPTGSDPSDSVGGSTTDVADDDGSEPTDGSFSAGLAIEFPLCEVRSTASIDAGEVLDLVNDARAAEGLAPLQFDTTLAQMAEQYACEMIQFDFFAHESPVTGSTISTRADDFGYDFSIIGENLAAGQISAGEVFDDWMGSPGHRANILDARFEQIGIAVREGGSFGVYWVQEFGTPR